MCTRSNTCGATTKRCHHCACQLGPRHNGARRVRSSRRVTSRLTHSRTLLNRSYIRWNLAVGQGGGFPHGITLGPTHLDVFPPPHTLAICSPSCLVDLTDCTHNGEELSIQVVFTPRHQQLQFYSSSLRGVGATFRSIFITKCTLLSIMY